LGKAFVIKEIGASDPTAWAVVEHERDGWKKKLHIHSWYETEDQARAAAHRHNHPEY
jgi:hypothetical protein